MLYGASSFIWTSPFRSDAHDIVAKIKGFGFDLIEVCIEQPEVIDVRDLRATLDRLDMKALVCGAFGPTRDLSSEEGSVRAAAGQYLRTCIDMAAELGSPTVSGPMYAGVGNTALREPTERKAQWMRAVGGMRDAAAYASDRGISLAFEPLNRFETDLVNTVDQGLRLIDGIGRPNVGFLLDTFHMNIEEKSIPDAIRRAGPNLLEFHACSSDRGTPGEDHLPWPEIVASLDEIGYGGPVVIEAFTPEIKEIARAVSLWRPLAESPDALARNGLSHLRRVFA